MPDPLPAAVYLDLVRRALAEDVDSGDVTTAAIVAPDRRARARIVAKETCVLAGLDLARAVFAEIEAAIGWHAERADGDRCNAGTVVARLEGSAASLLTAERTALNFLQHLSGIATLTRAFVDAAGGRLTILDTRKTIPTFRALAKYAVRCGGGTNHRAGLHDAVLIKDNHIRIAGGIVEAVRRVRVSGPRGPIEVETQSLEQVDEAIRAEADVIMLDNLDDETVVLALGRIRGRARVELSGNMTVERVRRLAGCGAGSVSIGALTHSAPAADLSLDMDVPAPADGA
jgi:nicotinate-nucleotide pyrophosphorylase (carboxylating)